jgi:hypothetical protein
LSAPPPMSNAQPPPGPPRQPVGYPSPTPYPSPALPPGTQYAYAAQAAQAAGDPYRASPAAVNSSMALPSMRTIDHIASQPPHAIPMGGPMAPPLPPATAAMGYYNVPPHAYGTHHDPTAAMRYVLPPNLTDPRVALSGGRHKKVSVPPMIHPRPSNFLHFVFLT